MESRLEFQYKKIQKQLIQLASEFGLSHWLVVDKSQELDEVYTKMMKDDSFLK